MIIRKAKLDDLARIAEIEVFNYRLNFYPIFKDDTFYFGKTQVLNVTQTNKYHMDQLWIYDDNGIVKGFLWVDDKQIKKLFVEPVLRACVAKHRNRSQAFRTRGIRAWRYLLVGT